MNPQPLLHKRHQFRLALFGHKSVEAGCVCLLLMVQGDLLAVTTAHLAVAAKTGLLAVSPAVAMTFTPFARHLVNRWTSSAFFGLCTFFADSAVHPSHFPGEYSEAAWTALGAFVFSVAVSYTSVGRYIDRLAHSFLPHAHTHREGVNTP
jgi:hypothetical protein